MRNLIRKLTPTYILKLFRKYKKSKVNKTLNAAKVSGQILTKSDLMNDFKEIGLKKGDTVLVHTSMSKIGYLENGPQTFVEALIEYIGEDGNIMMPTSPNALLQLDYARSTTTFNVNESPSALGAISEFFRKTQGVKRSWSPTEPVSAYGKDADFLTNSHHLDNSPYTANSPFQKLYQLNGKIMYAGVTLDNAGTNLHTLEDAVDFEYPVYYAEEFEFEVETETEQVKVRTKVHNPDWSKKRKCDELLPFFENKHVFVSGSIGNARTLLFDGKRMFEEMIKAYQEKGITMYHPKGNNR